MRQPKKGRHRKDTVHDKKYLMMVKSQVTT